MPWKASRVGAYTPSYDHVRRALPFPVALVLAVQV